MSWVCEQFLHLPFLLSDLDMFVSFVVIVIMLCPDMKYNTWMQSGSQYVCFPKKSICNFCVCDLISVRCSGCSSAW